MHIGAAYYPEHWPRERWATDASMMQAAGLTAVRMGEFAWTLFEPREGEFDFQWMDHAVELLGKHGIKTLMGTPTAAPPAWVVAQSPEILPLRADGLTTTFGSRRHYCPTQPAYRNHVRRLVHAMGKHYAANANITAWQVDNELGNYCYCDSCRLQFQEWLYQRYKTLPALNNAWGTSFWSQNYTNWSQIPAPLSTAGAHHPGLLLAWKRFTSDAWNRYFLFQRDVLREAGVKQPIATNMMGTFPHIDYWEHAQGQDFALWDNYSEPAFPWRYNSALSCDFMRSVKGGKPFWIAEQQSGCSGHDKTYGRTEPGRIRLMTYQGIALGAEAIFYFRWRTCRFGQEQYWHGILQHDGRANWRYEEVKRIAAECRDLPEDLFTARTPAKAALLYSNTQVWSHEAQPHVDGFSYEGARLAPYQALRDLGIDTDIVREFSDLSAYKLLILPAWQLIPPGAKEWIEAFVRDGGIAVFTFRSAVRDWENVIFAEPLPGPFRELLGITIDDYDAIGHFNKAIKTSAKEPLGFAEEITGSLWADVITLETAQAAAVFAEEYYTGRPAVTVNKFGRGQAWYVGSQFGPEFWKPLVAKLAQEVGIGLEVCGSDRVQIAHRQGKRLYTFLLNMVAESGWIELAHPMKDLLTGETVPVGRSVMPRLGVRVLVEA